MRRVPTVLFLLVSLLLAGCTGGDAPSALRDANTTDEKTLSDTLADKVASTPAAPTKPPTPPKIDVDRYNDPWLKAINMSAAGNCGSTYTFIPSCAVINFRLDAMNSTKDLSVGSCEYCSDGLTVVTDAGDRLQGELISGKKTAVAGFASDFTLRFLVPEGDKVIRLDLGQKHMDLPPVVAPRTYREVGYQIDLTGIALSKSCQSDLEGRWALFAASANCTIAHVVVHAPTGESALDWSHFRLRLANGTELAPLRRSSSGDVLNLSFETLPAHARVTLVLLKNAIPYSTNATVGERPIAVDHPTLTMAQRGYGATVEKAYVSNLCDVLAGGMDRYCTLVQLRLTGPPDGQQLRPSELVYRLPNGVELPLQSAKGESPVAGVTFANASLTSIGAGTVLTIAIRSSVTQSGDEEGGNSVVILPEGPAFSAPGHLAYTCPYGILEGPSPPTPPAGMRSRGCSLTGGSARTSTSLKWEDLRFQTRSGAPIAHLGNTSATASTPIAWCVGQFTNSWYSGTSNYCIEDANSSPWTGQVTDLLSPQGRHILFWWRANILENDPPEIWYAPTNERIFSLSW